MTPEERAEVQRRIDAGLVTRCPPGIAAGVTVHLLWIKTHRPGAPPLAESAPEWKDR